MKPWIKIYLVCCIIGLSLMSPVEAAIRQKQDILPRTFAYVIGDIITRTIILEVDHPHTLDQKQIPRLGRVNRWLEIRKNNLQIDRHRGFSRYQLELEYQIFNSEPGHTEIFLPGFDLILTTSERTLPVVFHNRPIHMTSVTVDDPSRSLEFLDLQPPISPQQVSEFTDWSKIGLAVLGLCFSFLLVVYIYAVLPWVGKLNGPFSQAVRKMRSLRKTTETRENYHQALRHIHKAFNQTYGKVLLLDDLDSFFQQKPAFSKLRRELTSLFVHSRAYFFSESETSEWTVNKILNICRQCRDIERGLM